MGTLPSLLKSRLKAGRFKHTAGVVKMALKLARHHREGARRVELAAWLHDCGKALDREAMQPLLRAAKADALEQSMPPLWHAPVGALLARREYGVKDPEVLKAIRFHSTGAPQMSKLQKILFVADYIEHGRPAWPELKALRRLALHDLNHAFLDVMRHKMISLLSNKRQLHPRSVDAYHDALISAA